MPMDTRELAVADVGLGVLQEISGTDGVEACRWIQATHKELQRLEQTFKLADLDKCLITLLYQGKIFATKETTYFAATRLNDSYLNIDEIIKLCFPSGVTPAENCLAMNMTENRITFKDFRKACLAPPSEETLAVLRASPRFLLPTEEGTPRVGNCSYMRTGSSMTRVLFEQITSLTSGSVATNDSFIRASIFLAGILGSGKQNDEVWHVKSHFPARSDSSPHAVARVIVIVRNPIDVMVSFLNLCATRSVYHVLANDFVEEFKRTQQWKNFVTDEIAFQREYLHYFKKVSDEVPIYFLRYEDVTNNKEKAVLDVLAFSFGVENLKGTTIEARVKEVLASEKQFRKREGSKGDRLDYLTPEQYNFYRENLKETIQFLDYEKKEGKEFANFMDAYEGPPISENFRDYNKKALKKSIQAFDQMKGHFVIDDGEPYIRHKDGGLNHLDFALTARIVHK